MASEVKVDTISEKTSGSGVTIDGLLIKDGGISGDVALIGTTPTFTIGDAGAEDAALVFDGNAQDFYIALDDSADDLLIGLGSTVGTTPAIAIDENLKVNIPVTTASTSASTGSLTTGGGAGIGADLYVGDDTYLITDSAVLGFGADKDTTLTHTDGTGLTLNSTNKLTFGDAASFIQQSSDGVLRIDGEATVDINASAAITLAAANVPVTVGGIPFYYGDTGSIYTHDVSGTDSTATYNTAYGIQAMDAITTGDYNTAIGYDAGSAMTTQTHNVLVGSTAGQALTTGSGASNIAIGANALQAADSETHNLAIGRDALLVVNSAGEYNVAIGNYALDALTSADYCVAVGYQALSAVNSGGSNVGIGRDAGLSITTGIHNIMIGEQAGDGYDTESYNIGIGSGALGGSIAGAEYNVAVGSFAGDAITSGDNNTGVGHNALTVVQAGTDNVGLGKTAGDTIDGGSGNICIGSGSDVTDGAGDFATALGYQVIGTAGYTTIGDRTDDIRAAHGNTTWATVSDERFKKNIETSDAGLAVINDLRPVTFNWKTKGEIPEWSKAYEKDSTEQYRNATHNHGFIAQEVKAIIESHSELKDGFSMWDEKSDGQQEIGETAIVPILVKAVQELSAEIKALKQKIGE